MIQTRWNRSGAESRVVRLRKNSW